MVQTAAVDGKPGTAHPHASTSSIPVDGVCSWRSLYWNSSPERVLCLPTGCKESLHHLGACAIRGFGLYQWFHGVRQRALHLLQYREGVNPDGKPFTKQVQVARGQVQPLWFGLDIPQDTPADDEAVKVTVYQRGKKLLLSVGNSVPTSLAMSSQPWIRSNPLCS